MKYNKFKLYLYFCITAFFLILAATLYYSFGYQYDLSTGRSFQTGAIVLRAIPNDAKIYKNGQEVKQSGFLNTLLPNFVKVENLEPGNYEIKVSKDGYNEWRKNADIKAGQVEKFEDIVLLKNDYKRLPSIEKATLADNSKTWANAEKNKIIFYGKMQLQESTPEQEGIFLINLENEEQKLILDKSQLDIMGELQTIKWTDDGNKVLIKASNKLYLIELGDNSKAYLVSDSASEVINKTPDAPIFIYDKFIIYPQNGSAYLFNYATKETKERKLETGNFYVYQGNIYFFRNEKNSPAPALFYTGLGDILAQETRVGYMPKDYDASLPFSVKGENDIVMVLANGSLYLANRTEKIEKINSDIKQAQFFQGGKRIIYSNDNEIWIYYTEDKSYQPVKSKGENELLTRFSGKLNNIYLYSDDEHIFFEENGIFKFAELDGRDNRNIFNVLKNPGNFAIFYSKGKNAIYYLDNGKLYKIDLKEK